MSVAVAASNGARTHLFGSRPSSLYFFGINENYPQTRKTTVTTFTAICATKINRLVLAKVKALWQAGLDQQCEGLSTSDAEAVKASVPAPEIATIQIPAGTMEDLWSRLSNDYATIKNAKECKWEHFTNRPANERFYFGSLINVDEVYRLFNDLDLLTPPSEVKGVNSHQSTLNRFCGTGRIAWSTKTQGSCGLTSDKTVAAGGVGNIHPATAIPLYTGKTGQSFAACLQRFDIVTQRPVDTYCELPEAFVAILPHGTRQHRWVPLEPIAKDIGLEDAVADPIKHLTPLPSSNAAPSFLPFAEEHTCMMLAINLDADPPTWWIRKPNRRLTVPERFAEERFVEAIFEVFAEDPNYEIPWTAEAQNLFEAFSLADECQCNFARRILEDTSLAATHGIGPLKLGLLAGIHCLFSIGVGEHDAEIAAAKARSESWKPTVRSLHVRRAKHLRAVLTVHESQAVKDELEAYNRDRELREMMAEDRESAKVTPSMPARRALRTKPMPPLPCWASDDRRPPGHTVVAASACANITTVASACANIWCENPVDVAGDFCSLCAEDDDASTALAAANATSASVDSTTPLPPGALKRSRRVVPDSDEETPAAEPSTLRPPASAPVASPAVVRRRRLRRQVPYSKPETPTAEPSAQTPPSMPDCHVAPSTPPGNAPRALSPSMHDRPRAGGNQGRVPTRRTCWRSLRAHVPQNAKLRNAACDSGAKVLPVHWPENTRLGRRG